MASEVDSWTDHQIREKFEELGCPVGPVTATTRRIMVKKLKALITRGGTPASPAPVQEDDEEVDDEPDVAPITRIPRRLPRSALAALNATQNADHSSQQDISPRTFSEQSTPERKLSESEVSRSRSTRRSSERINGVPERSPGRSPARTARKSVGRETEVRKSSGREWTPPTTENGSPMAVRKLTPGRRNVTQNEQTTSAGARMSFGINGNMNDPLGREESTSDDLAARIRKSIREGDRASSIANESFRSHLSSPIVRPDLDPKVSSGSSWRSPPSKADCSVSDDEEAIKSPVRIFRDKKRTEYEVHSLPSGKSSLPTLLLVILIPLSAIVAFIVLSSSSPARIASGTSLVYPMCRGQLSDVPGVNCLDELDKPFLESMLYAFDRGLDEMRAGVPCSTSVNRPVLIDNTLIKNLITSTDDRIDASLADRKLADLKMLIRMNPQLDFKPTADGLALVKGPDTIICSLWSRIVLLAEWTIRICLTIFSAVILFFVLRWHFSRQQKLQEELSDAVDKVVGLVKTRRIATLATLENELHSAGYSNGTTASAIAQAAKDSRISLEKLNNSGALRWTGGIMDTSDTDLVWDRSDKEDIAYFIPPSSCLKMRGMFTPSKLKTDNEVKKVVDAILDEAVGNRIVHVVVDSDSTRGVVYLRCLSKADAGGVYRRLHTCKFDGRLVTIKFLLESKYEKKFPESANYTLPLRSSARP